MLACGWRWTFVLTGAAGVVLALVWYGLYREPGSVGLTAAETAYLSGGEDETGGARATRADWWRLLHHRTTLGMVLGLFGETGWLTDRLFARGLSRVNSCKLPIVSGMVGMAGFTVVAALTPSTIVAVSAISVALLFGLSGATTSRWRA